MLGALTVVSLKLALLVLLTSPIFMLELAHPTDFPEPAPEASCGRSASMRKCSMRSLRKPRTPHEHRDPEEPIEIIEIKQPNPTAAAAAAQKRAELENNPRPRRRSCRRERILERVRIQTQKVPKNQQTRSSKFPHSFLLQLQ